MYDVDQLAGRSPRAEPAYIESAYMGTHIIFHGGDVTIGLADLDDKVGSGIDSPVGPLVRVAEGRQSDRGKERPDKGEQKHLGSCLDVTLDNACQDPDSDEYGAGG